MLSLGALEPGAVYLTSLKLATGVLRNVPVGSLIGIGTGVVGNTSIGGLGGIGTGTGVGEPAVPPPDSAKAADPYQAPTAAPSGALSSSRPQTRPHPVTWTLPPRLGTDLLTTATFTSTSEAPGPNAPPNIQPTLFSSCSPCRLSHLSGRLEKVYGMILLLLSVSGCWITLYLI